MAKVLNLKQFSNKHRAVSHAIIVLKYFQIKRTKKLYVSVNLSDCHTIS